MSGMKAGTDFKGQVSKRVWKIACFDLKLGQNLENRAAHSHHEFRGVTPPPPPPGGYQQDSL